MEHRKEWLPDYAIAVLSKERCVILALGVPIYVVCLVDNVFVLGGCDGFV
jgi:hypothetical protein